MAFEIYKSGQGYWTRMMTAVGVGVLTLTGVAWLWSELERLQSKNFPAIYVQASVATILILTVGIVTFYLLNKPNLADFMIATEGEMRKVNWPTKREVAGSTWVVIAGTVLISAILFAVDIGFLWLFRQIGILVG